MEWFLTTPRAETPSISATTEALNVWLWYMDLAIAMLKI